VECTLRCINFRRVSDPRREFLLAPRVTGISDNWYRNTMGVIVRGLGIPLSARENFECTWVNPAAPATSLGVPATSLGVPATSLGALAPSLGAPRVTVEQSGKNDIVFGNAAGVSGQHSYYL